MIVDMHCHILPGVDDGARDAETSLAMLKASSDQGVQSVVATPHFYATRDRVDVFLDRRRKAWETLKAKMTGDLPGVILGAEVAFFPGISQAARIEELRMEGTDSMLLEMPFRPWSDEDVNEVLQLSEKRGISLILAHIERYLGMRGNAYFADQLSETGIRIQINAESLLDWRIRGKMIRMVKDEKVHLLGSDSHGMHHRPPNLGEGREILRKKLGQECLDRMDQCAEHLLFGGGATR
jgi:protein-tyrosine phosphatase